MEFRETQPFWKQPIVWPIWLLFGGLVYYLMAHDLILASIGYIVIGVVLALNLLIFLTALETRIDTEGIRYRMRPLIRKWRVHRWHDIESCEVRKYRPLREYGGYGIRIGAHGKAYNVKGNMGLQLELRNGKKILIGTQQADTLKAFLDKLDRRNKQV